MPILPGPGTAPASSFSQVTGGLNRYSDDLYRSSTADTFTEPIVVYGFVIEAQ